MSINVGPSVTRIHPAMEARIAELQAEVKALAQGDLDEYAAMLRTLLERGAAISGGGETYPSGVRELVRQIGLALGPKGDTLDVLVKRWT